MNIADLRRITKSQIKDAGPRYGPGHTPGVPNLEIAPLVQAIDGLTYSGGLRHELERLREGLDERWKEASPAIRQLFRDRVRSPQLLQGLIQSLRDSSPGAGAAKDIVRLDVVLRSIQRRLAAYAATLREARGTSASDEERRRADRLDQEVRGLSRGAAGVGDFLRSPARFLMFGKSLLLLGEWGTGKTHFLCDLARSRLEAGQPSLLFLAQNLPTTGHPIDGLCVITELAPTREVLFAELNRMGKETGSRALLIVDGVNEGRRSQWRRVVRELAVEVGRLPHLGLILSCRSPFERLIFGQRSLRRYFQLQHPGFADLEFNAQLEFFSYYEIPTPAFPMLAPEFSRPLFLKLLCEALKNLSAGRQRQGLRDIASGQKGMTYVLEHFVKEMGKRLEQDHGLPSMSIWRLLKGSDSALEGSGLAGAMATEARDFLSRDHTLRLIRDQTGFSARQTRALLQRLIADGILAEGVRWDSDTETTHEIIQLPYQRFADHLIARHLLRTGLRTHSENALRRCFNKNRPLGRVFEIDRHSGRFARPGIASAVMLEFPERVKRVEFIRRRELVSYLPSRARFVWPLMEIFLDGLQWRSAESLSEDTDRFLDYYRKMKHPDVRNAVFATLIVLAARPGHRYDAASLHSHLAEMRMADRDLLWSEFLRGSPSDANRLIAWVEKNPHAPLTDGARRNTIRLLALLLTTTDRGLRDRATRALFLLGLHGPAALFEESTSLLSFNDPYVPERMLAASYGVAMNLWTDPDGELTRAALPRAARFLFDHMFAPGANSTTTHALRRDYSLGIIELGMKVAPNAIGRRERAFLKPPFDQIRSPFRPAEAVSDTEVADTEGALHMDFNNYTLGSLLTGRANYDFASGTYQRIRRELLGRMADLGYSTGAFGEVDSGIGRSGFFTEGKADRLDRYGKKYSWIAFFEMYGLRESRGELATEWRWDSRSSDCDIDPSFPQNVREWKPSLPELFRSEYEDPARWFTDGPLPRYAELYERSEVDGLAGPWTLLDGFVLQGASGDPREVFSFLRGVIVRDSDIVRLQETFTAAESLGNDRIPEPSRDVYTYAGEIPWRRRIGEPGSRSRRSPNREVRKAFERFSGGGWSRGIEIELPARTYAWESYHSSLNQVDNVDFPAPRICKELGLVSHARTFDLFDRAGRRAAVYRTFKASKGPATSRLLFLRRDLVNRYLAGSGRSLVWLTWGERTLHYEELLRVRDAVESARNSHANVHKRFDLFAARPGSRLP